MIISAQIHAVARSIENMIGSTTGWRGHLLRTTCLVLPFALFVLIAFGEVPSGLAKTIRHTNPIILFIVSIFFYVAYRLTGWLGLLGSLCATLFVFALDLAGVWLGESDGAVVVSGLLPWSDAGQYYWGAQLLEAGGQPAPWNGRRPLFMSLLAVLLAATQANLQWSIAILVAITAVAGFLFARAVQTSHGTGAAVAALMVVWIFYSRFIGTTLSEHLGLSLGTIALAVLWQSAHQSRLGLLWATGLWLLTCALAARAGAFFVLPALLVWGVWHSYHSVSRRESLKVLVMGGTAIGAGFFLDSLLRHALTPQSVPFGNFSYVLYGLIVGNKGWLQVRLDHPELLGLGETEAARQIYQLAFEAFVADPLRAVTGALRAWRQYFSYTWRGIFGFIPGHEARLIAIILSSLGLAYCLRHWREMPYSMILAMVVGVVLSVPFVPPIDSDSMRIYAATIPLTALLVALGVAFFLPRHGAKELPGGYVSPRIAASYGALMILVTFAGSITIKLLNEPAAYQSRACPAGQDNLYVRMTKGSSIQLVANEARAQTHVPEVRISDFKEGMHAYRRWYPALHSELENLQAGQEIRFAINLVRNRHGEPLWLMSDARTTPKTGVVRICARLSDNKAHKFYYAQEIQVIPESGF